MELHTIYIVFLQLCLLKTLCQQYWRLEIKFMGSTALLCIAD
jgi:hypothetical protein